MSRTRWKGLSHRPAVPRCLLQSCGHRPGYLVRSYPLGSDRSHHPPEPRLLRLPHRCHPAAVVGIATPTFSAATPTVAVTTLGANTPTVVVHSAVATVAALLIRPTAFLLFLLRGWPQNSFPGVVVGQSQGVGPGEGRGGRLLALSLAAVHCGPRPSHPKVLRRMQ